MGKFIPVIFPNYPVGFSQVAKQNLTAPLGHAGFIIVTDSGSANYYEWGRYAPGTPFLLTQFEWGNLRSISLNNRILTNSAGQIDPSVMQTALDEITSRIYTGRDVGAVFTTTYNVDSTQVNQMLVAVGSGALGPYDNLNNSCNTLMLSVAGAGGLVLNIDPLDKKLPASTMPFLMLQNGSGFFYFNSNSQYGPKIAAVNGFSEYLTEVAFGGTIQDRVVQFGRSLYGNVNIIAEHIGVTAIGNGNYQVQLSDGGPVTFDGTWNSLTNELNGVVANLNANLRSVVSASDRETNLTTTLLNGTTTVDILKVTADGARQELFDVFDSQLWTQQIVHIGSDDRIIADIRDYTAVANQWLVTHTLPTVNLRRADSEFITDFSAQIERAALHGYAIEQPTPEPIGFERTGFGFDLGAYAFDPSGTTFSLGGGGGGGSGFDLSGYVYGGGGALTLGLKVSVETNLMDLAFGGLGWLFPVVLDLDGNGVRIEPRMDSRVFFNADGDAALERTAWVGAGDGLLAHDLDGNGQITRADEIAFADRTPDPNDSDLTALATLYDANADGVLNAGDAIWNQLRVWKDTNRNGKSDIGELNSLAAWGISAISLVSDHRSFSLPDGSRIEGFGSFVMNGATRSLADTALAFQTNGFTRSTNGEFVHYTSQDNATVRTYVDARLTTSYNTPPGAVIEINVNPDPDGWLAGRFSDRILIRNATKPLTLYGDEGDDWLWSGAGNDVLDGGPGDEIFSKALCCLRDHMRCAVALDRAGRRYPAGMPRASDSMLA